MRERRASGAILVLGALARGLTSCRAPAAPAPIVSGSPCSGCGMTIGDLRFACERKVDREWRPYDSIECLIADSAAVGPAWLADYDAQTRHAAESVWVVRGDLPSPMGGGYAAFLDRTAADVVAAVRRGRVGRFADFVAGAKGATP